MGRTEVIIDLIVNSRDAAGDMDKAASKFDTFGGAMKGLAGPASIALGAIGGIAAGAASAASAAQQAAGGIDAVFGGAADAVHAWAASSATDTGLATSEYETMAASIGGALTGMGVPLDEAAKSTHDLMQRSADLASVFGGTTAQAADAMSSAFRGEYDALQRLIPSISGKAVEDKMAAEAAAGLTFASEEAAKAHAVTALVMDESAAAAGNFAKESDSAAGSQAIAQAQFQNTAAALGEQLLPAITKVMEFLTAMGTWISEHIPLVTTLAAIFGTLAVAVLAINAAMAVHAAASAVATAATAAWSAAAGIGAAATTAFGVAMAVLTSPITIIIAIILAVIAAIVLLVKNWDTVAEAAGKCWDFIRDAAGKFWDWLTGIVDTVMDSLEGAWEGFKSFMSGLWDGIKAAAGIAWEAIKIAALGPIGVILKILEAFGISAEDVWEGIKTVAVGIWEAIKTAATSALALILKPIEAVKTAITWTIDKIKSAINWASQLAAKIPFIGGLFGASAAAPAPAAGAPVGFIAAPRVHAPAGSGGGITINVTGALDPVQVARQIKSLLVAQDRRTFGMGIG